MKGIILTTFLLINLAAFGQTKKETIDWLNEKFYTSPIVTDNFGSMTRFLKIKSDGSFEVTSYDYSPDVLLPDLENYRFKKLISGHFKNLSLNSIHTMRKGKNVYFYASCTSGKCITQQNKGRDDFGTFYNSEVLLGISDPELETRIKKAFTHLIKLCGGKKEAF